MVKIRVIYEFRDIEHDLKLRKIGETMEVTKERAEYLVKMKVAEYADSKDSNPEKPIETQN